MGLPAWGNKHPSWCSPITKSIHLHIGPSLLLNSFLYSPLSFPTFSVIPLELQWLYRYGLLSWSSQTLSCSPITSCRLQTKGEGGAVCVIHFTCTTLTGFPWWLSSKESACNAGDAGDIGETPGSGKSPGEGNGNLLQYSCLENCMDRGAWWGTVHGVAKSWTWLKRPSIHACMQPWQDQREQPHPPQPAVFFSRLSVLLMYKLDGFCFPPRCFLVSWRRQIHQSLRISVSLHHHFGLFLVTLNFLIF